MKSFNNYMVKVYDKNDYCIRKEYFRSESEALYFIDKLKIGYSVTLTRVR